MSLWLARIPIDLRCRAARDDLADANSMHRRIMTLVPDRLGPDARHAAAVLFRVEDTASGPAVLVQAAYEPDLLRLPAGYLRTDQTGAAVRKLEPLLAALRPSMPVHYRVAANPSKRLNNNDDRTTRKPVVALGGREAELWWERKAAGHGLRLLSLHTDTRPSARANDNRMRHAITRFDGQAVVEDPDQVRAAIRAGIGRGKSYGCGLLSLAPIKTR
jgi:CRISPR system Cascade subunit CasE